MPAEQFNSTLGAPPAPTIPVVTLASAYANGAGVSDTTLTLDATRQGVVVTASGLTGVKPLTLNHTLAPAAGTEATISVAGNFAPTSGTATYSPVSLSYTVNQTGGANGAVTGVLLNATETAVVGTHNLLDLQVGGASKFKVSPTGRATITQSLTPTSGGSIGLSIAGTFAPTSGTATYNPISVAYTVNQTGGANGAVTGLLLNATETAVVGTHLLADLQVGGASKFTVTNAGRLGILTSAPEGGISIGSQALNLSGVFGASYVPYILSISNSDTNSFPGVVLGFSNTAQMRFYWSSAGGQLSSVGAAVDLSPATALTFYTTTGGRITSAGHWLVGNPGDANSKMRILGTTTLGSTGALAWNAFEVVSSTLTLTGTTTVNGPLSLVNFVGPTITDSSAVTVTQAVTLNITAAPTAGGSVTLTETLALAVQAGNVRFNGNLGIGATPTNDLHVSRSTAISILFQSTSNACTVNVKAAGAGNNAQMLFEISAGQDWMVGNKQTDGTFRVSNSTTLGTNDVLVADSSRNLVLAQGSLAAGATNGFPYIPTIGASPSGTPTAKAGWVPFAYDATNNKLYVYNAAWKQVGLA